MSLLNPISIAVVGASSEEKKVGNEIFKNLLHQGFKGSVYPINAKHDEVLAKKAYKSVLDLPEVPDLAVVVTPAATVAGVINECGKKGIKTVVVISAGFGETGTPQGKEMEKALVETARRHGIQLVGPNCLGILRPSIGMNASFAVSLPRKGNVALLSQSGALAVALMDASETLKLGFSTMISIGNKAAMNECDFLELCEADPETKVIGLYLESIVEGGRFRTIAERIAKTKPLVLIKSGVTEHGRAAVSSHTGALAGSDAGIQAVCVQTGIHRAHTAEEFLDLLCALGSQPPLLSSQIAIITNAGGPGILATDAAGKEGLQLPTLSDEHQTSLKAALPPAASVHNPIDVLGDALGDRYETAVTTAAKDPSVDGLVVVLTPQVMTPCLEIAKAIVKTMKHFPLVPITAGFMGAGSIRDAADFLRENGIPNYETPERAVHALRALLLSRRRAPPPLTPPLLRPAQDKLCAGEGKDNLNIGAPFLPSTGERAGDRGPRATRAREASAILEGMTGLVPEDAMQKLLTLYALPIPSQSVALTPSDAAALAKTIGFPVIAKISSKDILHKTDIGGVRANLNSAEEVEKATSDIFATVKKNAPNARIDGVLIQKFLPAGNEFIVGIAKDPTFGHLILAGLGGIYTELFRDTSFRIAPVTEDDVYAMLQELKAWKLLLGMRGKKPSDIAALVDLVCKTSALAMECPRISAIDFNPVLVDEGGVVIADAKVVI